VNFDRIAPHYRWLETLVFGQQLQAARIAFLREIESPRRVLVVGEGDGRFLAEFVRVQPAAEIDCVEASGRMIELAQRRVEMGNVRFIEGDVRDLELPAHAYDLIVTHFFLDCFEGVELCEVVQKLAGAARAEAVWLLADFRFPSRGWRRWHAKMWIDAMYLFFRLTSDLTTRHLEEPTPFLRAAGFSCIRNTVARFGMIQSAIWRRLAR
jgi:ubiquinone/menaquinone biosynthesis C-methylase UbiE